MNHPGLSPAPAQPDEAPYVYIPWPAWFYGPNGQSAVFQAQEEVPEGWVDNPAHVFEEAEKEEIRLNTEPTRTLTDEQRKDAINKLTDDNTQVQLVAMLHEMQQLDDKIEFLPTWGKAKLAEAIVDNGGPLEADKD